MKTRFLSYILGVSIISCKSPNKKEVVTLIPSTDRLFYYYGDSTQINNADSIEIINDDFNNEKIKKLLNQLKSKNDSVVLKPASVAGGLGRAESMMMLLDSSNLEYTLSRTMTLSEKSKFNVGDLIDIKNFLIEMNEQLRAPDSRIDGRALVFFIKPHNKLFYKIDSNYAELNSILVKDKSVDGIIRILDESQEFFNEKNLKFKVFIGGDGNSKFDDLSNLMEALSKKNIHYKFLKIK